MADMPRTPREKGTLAPGDEITDDATGERFCVLSLIGEGGMGRVFRVERVRDGAAFAVKCNRPIDPRNTELVVRMMREGDFLKALRPHPHIVPVLATGMREDGVFWILMPLLDGASVGSLLSVLRRIPPLWVFEICAAVCSALATVHEVGIHRDIKPENVFLTRDGGIYVLDFGAGKSYVVGRMTTTGTAIGTIPYMSPEQLTDAATIDGRSDLFSVGVLTFEMLSGENPFDGPGPLRGHAVLIGHRILMEPPRPLAPFAPELPGYVAQIVEKLLAKDRQDRSRNAMEAHGVLLAARDALQSTLGDPPPIARLFDAYDAALEAQEAARLGTQDTDKAPPPLRPSGPRPRLGTVPMAAFKPPTVGPRLVAAPPPPAPPLLAAATMEALPSAGGGTTKLDAATLEALAAAAAPVLRALPATAGAPAPVERLPNLAPASASAPATPKPGESEAEIRRKLLALEALMTDDSPETREVLLVTMSDGENHPIVRAGAAIALGVVGDETCLAALQECAEQDPQTMVRRMAEEAALSLSLRLGLPVEPVALPQAPAPAGRASGMPLAVPVEPAGPVLQPAQATPPAPAPRGVAAARPLAPAAPVGAPAQLTLGREPASLWAPVAREPASPWVQLVRAPAPTVVRTRVPLSMLLLTFFFALIFAGCVTAIAYLLLA